jgi:hypothetical protein
LRILRITALVLLLLAIPATAHAKAWTKDRLRSEISEASRYYHLSPSDETWLRKAGVDIVFVGAHESSGAKHAHSGQHRGMWQFNRSWRLGTALHQRKRLDGHTHSDGWECCRECSTYRFVKSYKDGGRAALRRHWQATLGR